MLSPSLLEERPRGSPQALVHLRQFQKNVLNFEMETGIILGQAIGQGTAFTQLPSALPPSQIPALPPFQCTGLEELCAAAAQRATTPVQLQYSGIGDDKYIVDSPNGTAPKKYNEIGLVHSGLDYDNDNAFADEEPEVDLTYY